MKLPLQGECRCGRVRIRVSKAPMMTAACHCTGCRRMSASAFSLTAICAADSFEVVQGEPVIGGNHSEEEPHFFCPHCMSWMFTRPAQARHIVNVRPSMFDDHTWFAPFIETYTKTKLPWAVTGALHAYEEFPPMAAFDGLMKEFAERYGSTR